MKNQDPYSAENLKKLINERAAKLGLDIQLDSDTALSSYTKGQPLTVSDAMELEVDDVVWVFIWYKGGDRGSGAYRVNTVHQRVISFEDGSSFGVDIELHGKDSDLALQDDDHGKVQLFWAMSADPP